MKTLDSITKEKIMQLPKVNKEVGEKITAAVIAYYNTLPTDLKSLQINNKKEVKRMYV